MKAVALKTYLPIDNPQSLLDVELEKPAPQGRDLLIAVSAISVNPVDTKVRAPKDKHEDQPRVLGWDAVGVVEAIGPAVSLFKPGDRVYYAGDITRPGSNSEYQLVDERIVGRAPASLSNAEAAALPLTAITAWEGLFDRLRINRHEDAAKTLLIIGGAGGVGSIAIQLAKQLTKVTVIATASRPETREWCLSLGADYVVDHRELINSMHAAGHEQVDYIFCLNNTDQHWLSLCDLVKPQGIICSIVETKQPVELNGLKNKSASFVWELMFTRSMFQTDDMIEQHHLLNELSGLIDAGKIKTTVTNVLSPINAENLRKAHAQLESGRTIGKVVLEHWH
ncbi:zinc-binding alcohol dehydrogenase family protein [Cellvibrio sp. PSBB006]|uniref:zinc-binding alcohol dehydrogenase family protein n=1 Tax=Cellvibrio sp. PSBB006 TaxID=1987723 RepID=UPI000B3B95F7|nr:zinc-binding alcohol dehydrogenase family protein [Cellvibrio sp. PSBB006]ARU26646.1 NADPH:quinone reductase [Cellvibrio sp. PSBB006]